MISPPPRLVDRDRKRIGLVLLSSDQVGERAFGRIVEAAGADYFSTRQMYRAPDDPAAGDEDRELVEAIGTILPDEPIDLIAYSCTSRSAEAGEQATIDLIASARPGTVATTPLTAALAALGHLGARRIALVSPYARKPHHAVVAAFEQAGFEVVRSICYELAGTDFPRLDPKGLVETCRALAEPGIDAIFLSCTGMRSSEAVLAAEAAIGLPVVTSSQALAWHSLRLLGLRPQGIALGRLFTSDEE